MEKNASLWDALAIALDHLLTATPEVLGQAQQTSSTWCSEGFGVDVVLHRFHPQTEVGRRLVQISVGNVAVEQPSRAMRTHGARAAAAERVTRAGHRAYWVNLCRPIQE